MPDILHIELSISFKEAAMRLGQWSRLWEAPRYSAVLLELFSAVQLIFLLDASVY